VKRRLVRVMHVQALIGVSLAWVLAGCLAPSAPMEAMAAEPGRSVSWTLELAVERSDPVEVVVEVKGVATGSLLREEWTMRPGERWSRVVNISAVDTYSVRLDYAVSWSGPTTTSVGSGRDSGSDVRSVESGGCNATASVRFSASMALRRDALGQGAGIVYSSAFFDCTRARTV
jgi:hypothetical protein